MSFFSSAPRWIGFWKESCLGCVGGNDLCGNDVISWVEEEKIDGPSMGTEPEKLGTDIFN